MTNNKNRKPLIITISVITAFIISFVLFVFFGTSMQFENKTIQEKTILSTFPEDYLTGSSILINWAKVDLSQVDANTPGQYDAACNVLFKKHKFTVNVVAPKFETTDIELGTDPDKNIATYLAGDDTYIQNATLDVSNVNGYQLGKYEANVKIDDLTFSYEICVTDTTAPTLELHDVKYLAMLREYDEKHFVKNSFDLSGPVDISLESKNQNSETLNFDKTGNETIYIVGKDSSGNVTREKLTVTVDIAPLIVGVFDTYVIVGEEFDAKDNLVVYDNEEGDITKNVEITKNTVKSDTPGEYKVAYKATDKNGLTTEKEVQVYVCEKKDKANFVHLSKKNIPEEELFLLCETDYFATTPLAKEDKEAALEMIIPSTLRLGKKYTNSESFGTGFIYDITPEYTYIFTVKHVVRNFGKNCDIMFWDDVEINAPFIWTTGSKTNELVMARIKTEDIPADTLLQLKEPYVDENVYADLTSGQDAIQHSENWGFDYASRKQQTKYVKIKNVKDSLTQGVNYKDACISTTRGARAGMSGGPMIDYYGRVIGSASCIYKDADYYMRIENLDIMMKKLQEEENE